MTGVDQVRRLACHWLLLRLAGTAPDDLITQCRQWLDQGQLLDIARSVTYAVLSQHFRLANPDIGLLAELRAADAAGSSALSMVSTADFEPMPPCGFAPTRAALGGGRCAAADARPVPLLADAVPEDEVDRAAIAAADETPAVRALWRVWRFPGDGAPWPPPRRVYVVEVGFNGDLSGIAAETQRRLAAAGEVWPQVEVYPTGLDEGELPSYQRLARGNGALLWARDPDPGIRVAELLDVVGEHGGGLASDHPRVPADELIPLLQYLSRGAPLLATTARMDDVLDPSRTGVISMDLRTDGYWIWSEATVYYLRRYRLAPDPALLAHVRERGYRCGDVDGAAVHRALAVLREPATDEPTWVYSS